MIASDGTVRPKPLGSREHALFSWRDATSSLARRGAVVLHGAARTLVLRPVHDGLRHLIIDTLATRLGAPCDVFAAVSLFDDRTAVGMNPGGGRAFMNCNASREMLVSALHRLVPNPRAATLSWRKLAFDCLPPTRRMDDACTLATKRAQFKHTPSMIIQATQIEAAFDLLHAAARGRVAKDYDWILRTRPDMQWVASPTWPALLAARLPSLTICARRPPCTLRAGRCSSPAKVANRLWLSDGSAFGNGGGRNISNNELAGEVVGLGSACCNHFEGFNSQCVLMARPTPVPLARHLAARRALPDR